MISFAQNELAKSWVLGILIRLLLFKSCSDLFKIAF